MFCVLLGALECIWWALHPQALTPRIRALQLAFLLWISSFVPILVESGDWVHLLWMVQVPIAGLFMISGVFLFTAYGNDGEPDAVESVAALQKRVSPSNAAWWFFAMMASLGIAPLLLIAIFQGAPEGRNIGQPVRRLFELAQWGFGGALPECLGPLTFEEQARGVGHLPREVTVPMGALLISSWAWIAFCALAMVGRLLPWPRIRRGFLLLSPLALGLISLWISRRTVGTGLWFDARYFWAGASEESGIWTSDPVTMKSFGPVLVAAMLGALLLACLQLWSRTGKQASASKSGRVEA